MAAPPQLSTDRRWWWDGERWQRAITQDGLWRFDGRAWKPVDPPHRDWLTGCLVRLVTQGLVIIAAIALAILGVTLSVYALIFVASLIRGHG